MQRRTTASGSRRYPGDCGRKRRCGSSGGLREVPEETPLGHVDVAGRRRVSARPRREKAARAIREPCPVSSACDLLAKASCQAYGVWRGRTEAGRRERASGKRYGVSRAWSR
ncbi:WhiB family transcriptional regulator [Streptomyces olivaceoviridis]|uniref:WhiB family transcriptional regulator n=1 Tax=Streptomyces olivaceoviridis TaxID=1921 RepID=UPI0036B655A2